MSGTMGHPSTVLRVVIIAASPTKCSPVTTGSPSMTSLLRWLFRSPIAETELIGFDHGYCRDPMKPPGSGASTLLSFKR